MGTEKYAPFSPPATPEKYPFSGPREAMSFIMEERFQLGRARPVLAVAKDREASGVHPLTGAG